MHRLSGVFLALTLPLLRTAALMQSGRWCAICQDEKDEVCDEGRCLEPDRDDGNAMDTIHHEPACEWGGGD